MTRNFDDFFKKYENPVQQDTSMLQTPQLPMTDPTPFAAGLKAVERTGGALLTNTVKGISAIGQSVMGVFDYLENNSAAYDQLFGVENGQTDSKAGQFHWDKVDDFVGGALKAGVNQGQRILQSKDLTELGQNSYTGVDFLKNLPGGAGEFYRDQTSGGAKFATGVAGLGLEILLDPSSALGTAAFRAAGKSATALGASARNADVIGRVASNAVSGNWVGGAVATTAREAAFASKEKLVRYANKFEGTRKGKAAETMLEWAMGPSALTTNGEMRTVLSKYAALKEDLPKEMLRIANNTATIVAPLPAKQRDMAQQLFSRLASASDEATETSALESLAKLGVDKKDAASIAGQYRNANLRLIDIIQSASNDVPGLQGISAELSEYHVRRSYRMFVDPKVRDNWLDHLVKVNTPGSFQIKSTGMAQQLRSGLELDDIEVVRTIGGPQNVGRVKGSAKTNFNSVDVNGKQLPTERTVNPTFNELGADSTELNKYVVSKGNVNSPVAKPKDLQDQAKLTQMIDVLDGRIESATGRTQQNLIKARNTYQGQLELITARLDASTSTPGNTGTFAENAFRDTQYDTQLAKGRKDATYLANSSAAGADLADGSIVPKVTNDPTKLLPQQVGGTNTGSQFMEYWDENQFRQGLEANVPARFKDELFPEEVRAVPSVSSIAKQVRSEYMDDLTKYMETNDNLRGKAFVGFRKDDNGAVLADFAERNAKARNATLADIHDWTADWAKAKGLGEDELAKLNAAVSNSLTYVPGSREFVSMVRTKGQAFTDIDPQLRQIMQSELGVSQVDAAALSDRTLDPIFQDLFGAIDNFSVNTAEQGVAVGAIAAKAKMLSELKQRNLVYTERELADNPELNALGGWVRMDNIFQKEGEATSYYMQRTNQRSLEAIDRSLGDMNKMQALSQASNLFRRAALVTDPSAHATQFMGNIAMLQMMGLRRLFGNDVNLVKGMQGSFKSVMLNDDSFKDAVDAGVAVTQTILSEQQSAQLARSLLGLPRFTGGDRQGAFSNMFRIASEVYGAGASAVDNSTRRAVAGASNAMQSVGVLKNGTDAINGANLGLSASAMFQLPDQMTRMFAYRSALQNKTQAMIKANPILANFTQDGGRINWSAAEEHVKKLNESGQTALSPEILADLKQTHNTLREESAAIANDVALNYSDVPLAVNYLSKTGVVPFIKFQYKATGRIMQFMDERPWAFSPYYAAQRNLNDGLNPDPDHFEEQRNTLSPSVRDAMVIPTGAKDSMGRQEFVDLSRWLPFGMYANSANGGQQEGGLSNQPNAIVSTPILDLMHTFLDADTKKQPGQSMASFMAQELAATFSPAGVGVGSRKIETLAAAIQQSMHYVDADGNVVERTPNAAEKAIVGYAGIPEQIGQAITQAGNAVADNETLTSAFGTPKPQTAGRPRTTVEQAYGRYAVPGVGFSADTEKTVVEYDKRYEARINELTKMRNSVANNMGANIGVDQIKQVERIDSQIAALKQQAQSKGMSLLLGE